MRALQLRIPAVLPVRRYLAVAASAAATADITTALATSSAVPAVPTSVSPTNRQRDLRR